MTSWSEVGPGARAGILDEVIVATESASAGWMAAACEAKGLAPNSGEERFAGIVTFVRLARLLAASLRTIEKTGAPPVVPTSSTRAQVFPNSKWDRILFAGVHGEVWLDESGQGRFYKDPVDEEVLVLAAGNVASLGPRDALDKLFVEGKSVVMKANPVNDYLVPHWEKAMAPLIRRGVLTIETGGADVGERLVKDPRIGEIHITGSDRTYNAIRPSAGDKPITAELGNVSPVVVMPGRWDAADLVYQAEHIATMLTNNAGFNCLTPRVLITHEAWPQREAFLGALGSALEAIPTKKAYYPGAEERYGKFTAGHRTREFGRPGVGELPWAVVSDLDPGRIDEPCFKEEAFCSLMGETALAAASTEAFSEAALEFCNDVLWGTLSATVLAKPDTVVEPLVEGLRYGAVGVNIWHATAFALGTTTWGAYPGHTPDDIGSGVGVVGNALMFDAPLKSVVRGPWRARPKPPWFAGHRRGDAVMAALERFEAAPSLARLPGVLGPALRP